MVTDWILCPVCKNKTHIKIRKIQSLRTYSLLPEVQAYSEINIKDSNFLKKKTSLFIELNFIPDPNPVKNYLRAKIDNKRNVISIKPYLFYLNCFNTDFDIVANG